MPIILRVICVATFSIIAIIFLVSKKYTEAALFGIWATILMESDKDK